MPGISKTRSTVIQTFDPGLQEIRFILGYKEWKSLDAE